MANTKKFKKIIAIVITLALVFNGISITASAAQAEPDLVQNFSDTYYKQDGSKGSAADWEIHLSKTATPTSKDNVYDINLKIQTKDTTMQLGGAVDGAVALVLDVSNSMNNKISKKSSVSHLDNLKDAVEDFLNEYVKNAKTGDKRLVSVAVFGTNAITIQSWTDVTNKSNLEKVISKVNSLSTGNGARLGDEYLCRGGTNMEAGLVLGRNLLNQSDKLNGISTENQSLIFFSDGEPTAAVYSVKDDSVSKVKYDGGDTGKSTDWSDYNDISKILQGISANKIAVKYGYNDSKNILSVPPFTRVITSSATSLGLDLTAEAGKVITNHTVASTVTDPMGKGVSMVSFSNNYNAEEKTWDLTKYTPSVINGVTTYTISYQVEIDPKAVETDKEYPAYTILTPANGETTLNYAFGEENTAVSVDFNEPNIRGIIPFNVSYKYIGTVPQNAPAVPDEDTFKAGEFVDVADAPVLENYTFSGWDKEDFVMPTEDVVISGFWIENPKYDYSLIYNANFGENEEKADSENVTAVYDLAYNIKVDQNTFTRENYTFIGWNTKPDGSGKGYSKDEAVALTAEDNSETLYAQWSEDAKFSYGVIYNANYGIGETKADSENKSGIYDTSYEIEVDQNTFVRENHTFIGWNTEPDGSGKSYEKGDKVELDTENNFEVLYAQWQEHEKYDYSLIYNANFGENEEKADKENVEGVYDLAYEIEVDQNTFTRENYDFIGWNTQADGLGKAYEIGEEVELTAEENNEVLYAQWQEHEKYNYSLIYNANFGENEEKADKENVEGVYDLAYEIEVDQNTFTRENYDFIGWNTEADGSGDTYAQGSVVELDVSYNNEVLYAQWQEHEKYDYSLIYNANFGENELKADSENAENVYNEIHNIKVDENAFVREGFTFAGWNTEADGSGEEYETDGIVVLTAEENTETLYAQWVEAEEPPVEEPPVEEPPVDEEEIEIEDEPVPLGEYEVPQTGDSSILVPAIAFVVSALGILALLLSRKKESNKNEAN